MLKILRNKKTAKKIWLGLAIIIIPAFAFWGFGGSGGDDQGPAATVGKIFGRSVSALEFRDSLVAVRTMALMQFGDKLGEIEKYLNFESQAWERLILLHEAKRRHIRVKDSQVIQEIQSAPYFQDKKGFSNKVYQDALRYGLRLQPRVFEEQTRQNLILAKLYDQITGSVKLTDEQVHQEYLKENQQLSIYYIASLVDETNKNINPTDKQIQEYFSKNKAMFKMPPEDGKPARIPELAEVTKEVREELVKEMAKNIAKEKIDGCAEKLKQMDFNQAASASGLKSADTGFFKSSDVLDNLGPARIFWQAAHELKDNQYSRVISNDRGYFIVKLKSSRPADEEKFLKEKESFSKRLLNTKKNELFDKFSEELKKKAQ